MREDVSVKDEGDVGERRNPSARVALVVICKNLASSYPIAVLTRP